MGSLQTLERRIAVLEARLAEIEGGYGDTLYKLRRDTVEAKLGIAEILNHLQLKPVSRTAIDASLDED